MADTVTSSYSMQATFIFDRDGDANSRTITFDIITFDQANAKAKARAWRSKMLEDYDYFIQPTGWRDADDHDEEWRTTDIKMKLVDKNEWAYDFS